MFDYGSIELISTFDAEERQNPRITDSPARESLRHLHEIDRDLAETAERIEHCRAILRESDRFLERLRTSANI